MNVLVQFPPLIIHPIQPVATALAPWVEWLLPRQILPSLTLFALLCLYHLVKTTIGSSNWPWTSFWFISCASLSSWRWYGVKTVSYGLSRTFQLRLAKIRPSRNRGAPAPYGWFIFSRARFSRLPDWLPVTWKGYQVGLFSGTNKLYPSLGTSRWLSKCFISFY